MSLKDHVAFGKNTHLQKQFEHKCVGLQRTFRHNRRKFDVLEEECVATLYGLLLDARSHLDIPTVPSPRDQNRPSNRQTCQGKIRRTQSLREDSTSGQIQSRNPVSAISLRNFVQSYSFKRDGLNIAQKRTSWSVSDKSRYAKDKGDNQSQKENNQRPKTSVWLYEKGLTEDSGETERPKSVGFNRSPSKTLLNRKQLPRPVSGDIEQDHVLDQNNLPKTDTHNHELLKSSSIRMPTSGRQSVMFTRTDTPALLTIQEGVQTELPDLQESLTDIRISKLRNKDTDISRDSPQPRSSSVLSFHHQEADEEIKKILSQGEKEHEENQLTVPRNGVLRATSAAQIRQREENANLEIMRSKSAALHLIRSDSSMGSSKVGRKSRSRKREDISNFGGTENDLLQISTSRTQNFLKMYAKKSKLYSYVAHAHTSASHVSRDLPKRSKRSPMVTYQELVTIKANISKHETETRMLLRRSEAIRHFVENLATRSRTK